MRYEKIKLIRKKLQNNQVTIGTWQQIPHASISEILGNAGYDWVTVDMEHGSISVNKLPDLFRAIELGGTLPLVRVAEATSKDCALALDAGAGGIIAPMIESADQLELIREACCWPPAGTRGVGFSRANHFGKHFDKYKLEAQAPLLIAQIEHIKAVNNLEKILQVEGLDAIMVGPYDLSASIGLISEFDNKEYISVMNQIKDVCNQYKIPYGDHVVYPDLELLQKRIDQGYQFLAFSVDSVFLHNSSQFPRLKR